mgnify:CR=1 FL=1
MGVVKTHRKKHNFSIIDNSGANDEELSYKAKGILWYLLTKPEDWKVSMKDIEKRSPKEGRDAIASGFKELEDSGYAVRWKVRNSNGRFSWETHVFECREDASNWKEAHEGLAVCGRRDHSGLAVCGSPVSGKGVDIVNTERPITEELINKSPLPPTKLPEPDSFSSDKVTPSLPTTPDSEKEKSCAKKEKVRQCDIAFMNPAEKQSLRFSNPEVELDPWVVNDARSVGYVLNGSEGRCQIDQGFIDYLQKQLLSAPCYVSSGKTPPVGRARANLLKDLYGQHDPNLRVAAQVKYEGEWEEYQAALNKPKYVAVEAKPRKERPPVTARKMPSIGEMFGRSA